MSVESSASKSNSQSVTKKQSIRKGVFIPSFLVVGGAALLGIFNNEMLSSVAMSNFTFSLRSFGWLYQLVSIVALFFAIYMTFSKLWKHSVWWKGCKTKLFFYGVVCHGTYRWYSNRGCHLWCQ